MKTFFTFLVAVIVVSQVQVSFTDQIHEEWSAFKITYGKKYDNGEEEFRKRIFIENKDEITKHNAKYELGLVSYELGMNRFGDLRHHEFVHRFRGYNRTNERLRSRRTQTQATNLKHSFISRADIRIPDTIDWRTRGGVTGVKSQDSCGSCWAFSATGALEGQYFRKTGNLVSLSEQNLIDCSDDYYGNSGCDGGVIEYAFQYVKDNDGIDTEESYPYENRQRRCRFNSANVGGVTVDGWVKIPEGDEQKLKEAVATTGPVSVAIDSAHEGFQLYKRGVFYEPDCSSVNLDHAVLAVGYGTDETGHDYWLVKNSWGITDWGDNGYIKMARNRESNCGIATSAIYPIV